MLRTTAGMAALASTTIQAAVVVAVVPGAIPPLAALVVLERRVRAVRAVVPERPTAASVVSVVRELLPVTLRYREMAAEVVGPVRERKQAGLVR
jgi:hypothetical protein